MITYSQTDQDRQRFTVRVAEVSPRYNDWPNMRLVRVEVLDDPARLATFAYRAGSNSVCRLARLPDLVAEHGTVTRRPGAMEHVYLFPPLPPGQEVIDPGHNLMGFIPPGFNTPALLLTFGCEHAEMGGRTLGNCYNEYACKSCSLRYRVDSSD